MRFGLPRGRAVPRRPGSPLANHQRYVSPGDDLTSSHPPAFRARDLRQMCAAASRLRSASDRGWQSCRCPAARQPRRCAQGKVAIGRYQLEARPSLESAESFQGIAELCASRDLEMALATGGGLCRLVELQGDRRPWAPDDVRIVTSGTTVSLALAALSFWKGLKPAWREPTGAVLVQKSHGRPGIQLHNLWRC
jgi:hypothetical protein